MHLSHCKSLGCHQEACTSYICQSPPTDLEGIGHKDKNMAVGNVGRPHFEKWKSFHRVLPFCANHEFL